MRYLLVDINQVQQTGQRSLLCWQPDTARYGTPNHPTIHRATTFCSQQRAEAIRRSSTAPRAKRQAGQKQSSIFLFTTTCGYGSLPGKHRRTTTLRTAPCWVTTIKTERLCDRYGQFRQICDEVGKVGKTRGAIKPQARSHVPWAWGSSSNMYLTVAAVFQPLGWFAYATYYQFSTN